MPHRYASPEDGTAGALVTLNTVTSKVPKTVSLSAFATPITPPNEHPMRGSPVLPSHISVFGHKQPPLHEGDELMGGGVKLPSHISAFGDGDDVDSAYLLKQLNGQTLHPMSGQQIMNSGLFLANLAPGGQA